jgi:ketosteroid isomerase-like protein
VRAALARRRRVIDGVHFRSLAVSSGEVVNGPQPACRPEWATGGHVDCGELMVALTRSLPMADKTATPADRFMAALHEAERSHDPNPLVDLFHADAELHTLAKQEVAKGRDGASRFWGDYLKVFETVKSEFTRVVADGEGAAMEWVADGTLANGKAIRYRGVSVIEVDGELVKTFRTYYDTAAFVTPAPASA